MDDYIDIVRATAKALNLLDKDGRLMNLDSLSVTEFTVGLEESTQMTIPTAALRPEAFVSIEAVATLLQELSQKKNVRRAPR